MSLHSSRRTWRYRSMMAQRLIAPVATILSGVIVYFLMFRVLVDPLAPGDEVLNSLTYVFLWEGAEPAGRAEVLAADLNARYAQAVPSVLLSLCFLATLIVALGHVLPAFGPGAVICGCVGAGSGALLGLAEQYNNPLRRAVADCPDGLAHAFCPLDQAVARAADTGSFTAEALSQLQFLTHWNSAISVAGICLLAVCFLFVSRSAHGLELNAEELRRRRGGLLSALVLAGLLLVFSVATTHGFYHASAALMAPESGEAVAQLASAGTMYWGTAYSTVFVVIAMPAVVSLRRDVLRGAERALPEAPHSERQAWLNAQGLGLDLKESLGVAATMITPVLTGPALDAFKGLVAG